MSRNRRCTVIDLREGPGDGVRIPIEPINRTVVHNGETYFRMDHVTHHPEGEPIGQCYLWEGYWPARLAKAAAMRTAPETSMSKPVVGVVAAPTAQAGKDER